MASTPTVSAQEMKQILHRPLIVGLNSVFEREDAAVGSYQEIRGQSELALAIPRRLRKRRQCDGAARPGEPRAPRQIRTQPCLDAKFPVQGPCRIGDDGAPQVSLVRHHGLHRGIKHRHLADPRGGDFFEPLCESVQVQICSPRIRRTAGTGGGRTGPGAESGSALPRPLLCSCEDEPDELSRLRGFSESESPCAQDFASSARPASVFSNIFATMCSASRQLERGWPAAFRIRLSAPRND